MVFHVPAGPYRLIMDAEGEEAGAVELARRTVTVEPARAVPLTLDLDPK